MSKIPSTELVESSNSPSELISAAIAKGSDLAQLEKLLTLKERYEAGEAKKAYHAAMSAFKENPPQIDKDKKVSFGNTKYNHASLANVTAKIGKELSKYGLSASWTTKQDNGTISVTCKITHVKGHSEETTITAAPDNSGSKNSIQAIGSTITYLERYTLLALAGLATKDMDDDAQGAAVEYITDKQKSQIVDMLTDMGYDAKHIQYQAFLKSLKVESIDQITKAQFQTAMKNIQAAKAYIEKQKAGQPK